MKVIKLTESELNRIIKRVLQTEQESEEEPNKNIVIGLRNFSKGRITKNDLYELDNSIYDIDVNEPLGQSIITIKFEDDKELFKEMDMDEQDIWFMQSLNSYNGYEYFLPIFKDGKSKRIKSKELEYTLEIISTEIDKERGTCYQEANVIN